MKKVVIFLNFLAFMLMACEGSETYRGSWKATDSKGKKIDIVFEADNFVVNNSGKKQKFEYTQNSVSVQNSVTTYGIKIDDGRGYQIYFPNSKDETMGFIRDENGVPIYTISRNDYKNYEDVYKLE